MLPSYKTCLQRALARSLPTFNKVDERQTEHACSFRFTTALLTLTINLQFRNPVVPQEQYSSPYIYYDIIAAQHKDIELSAPVRFHYSRGFSFVCISWSFPLPSRRSGHSGFSAVHYRSPA
jgi:hypothetical protein